MKRIRGQSNPSPHNSPETSGDTMGESLIRPAWRVKSWQVPGNVTSSFFQAQAEETASFNSFSVSAEDDASDGSSEDSACSDYDAAFVLHLMRQDTQTVPGPTFQSFASEIGTSCAFEPEAPQSRSSHDMDGEPCSLIRESALPMRPKRRFCDCGRTRPSLGIPSEGKASARWCSQCPGKPSEAVNVIHRRCCCGRSLPSLAFPGQSRRDARWCAKCPSKPTNAVDVTSRKCLCRTTRPTFGFAGEGLKDARWCSRCPGRPSNAISLLKRRR